MSQRKKKPRKKKGRPARPPQQMAVRKQLKDALQAVEGLKGLETLADAGPMLQKVYDTVVELAPIMDAVIADHTALNEEVETLKQCVGTMLPHVDLPNEARSALQERLASHMEDDDPEDEEPKPDPDEQ